MRTGYDSKYVVCPFYRRNDTNRICCEGVEDNNTINLVFGSSREMIEYEKCFCDDMDFHQECLLYQMLKKKYEEENGDV